MGRADVMVVLFWDNGERLERGVYGTIVVPWWYHGTTMVRPGKCQGKAGAGRCLSDSKCLCFPCGRSGGRASARAQKSKDEGRTQNAEWLGEAARSHPQATSMRHQSHLNACC